MTITTTAELLEEIRNVSLANADRDDDAVFEFADSQSANHDDIPLLFSNLLIGSTGYLTNRLGDDIMAAPLEVNFEFIEFDAKNTAFDFEGHIGPNLHNGTPYVGGYATAEGSAQEETLFFMVYHDGNQLRIFFPPSGLASRDDDPARFNFPAIFTEFDAVLAVPAAPTEPGYDLLAAGKAAGDLAALLQKVEDGINGVNTEYATPPVDETEWRTTLRDLSQIFSEQDYEAHDEAYRETLTQPTFETKTRIYIKTLKARYAMTSSLTSATEKMMKQFGITGVRVV
jgi:hypothetical protein